MTNNISRNDKKSLNKRRSSETMMEKKKRKERTLKRAALLRERNELLVKAGVSPIDEDSLDEAAGSPGSWDSYTGLYKECGEMLIQNVTTMHAFVTHPDLPIDAHDTDQVKIIKNAISKTFVKLTEQLKNIGKCHEGRTGEIEPNDFDLANRLYYLYNEFSTGLLTIVGHLAGPVVELMDMYRDEINKSTEITDTGGGSDDVK